MTDNKQEGTYTKIHDGDNSQQMEKHEEEDPSYHEDFKIAELLKNYSEEEIIIIEQNLMNEALMFLGIYDPENPIPFNDTLYKFLYNYMIEMFKSMGVLEDFEAGTLNPEEWNIPHASLPYDFETNKVKNIVCEGYSVDAQDYDINKILQQEEDLLRAQELNALQDEQTYNSKNGSDRVSMQSNTHLDTQTQIGESKETISINKNVNNDRELVAKDDLKALTNKSNPSSESSIHSPSLSSSLLNSVYGTQKLLESSDEIFKARKYSIPVNDYVPLHVLLNTAHKSATSISAGTTSASSELSKESSTQPHILLSSSSSFASQMSYNESIRNTILELQKYHYNVQLFNTVKEKYMKKKQKIKEYIDTHNSDEYITSNNQIIGKFDKMTSEVILDPSFESKLPNPSTYCDLTSSFSSSTMTSLSSLPSVLSSEVEDDDEKKEKELFYYSQPLDDVVGSPRVDKESSKVLSSTCSILQPSSVPQRDIVVKNIKKQGEAIKSTVQKRKKKKITQKKKNPLIKEEPSSTIERKSESQYIKEKERKESERKEKSITRKIYRCCRKFTHIILGLLLCLLLCTCVFYSVQPRYFIEYNTLLMTLLNRTESAYAKQIALSVQEMNHYLLHRLKENNKREYNMNESRTDNITWYNNTRNSNITDVQSISKLNTNMNITHNIYSSLNKTEEKNTSNTCTHKSTSQDQNNYINQDNKNTIANANKTKSIELFDEVNNSNNTILSTIVTENDAYNSKESLLKNKNNDTNVDNNTNNITDWSTHEIQLNDSLVNDTTKHNSSESILSTESNNDTNIPSNTTSVNSILNNNIQNDTNIISNAHNSNITNSIMNNSSSSNDNNYNNKLNETSSMQSSSAQDILINNTSISQPTINNIVNITNNNTSVSQPNNNNIVNITNNNTSVSQPNNNNIVNITNNNTSISQPNNNNIVNITNNTTVNVTYNNNKTTVLSSPVNTPLSINNSQNSNILIENDTIIRTRDYYIIRHMNRINRNNKNTVNSTDVNIQNSLLFNNTLDLTTITSCFINNTILVCPFTNNTSIQVPKDKKKNTSIHVFHPETKKKSSSILQMLHPSCTLELKIFYTTCPMNDTILLKSDLLPLNILSSSSLRMDEINELRKMHRKAVKKLKQLDDFIEESKKIHGHEKYYLDYLKRQEQEKKLWFKIKKFIYTNYKRIVKFLTPKHITLKDRDNMSRTTQFIQDHVISKLALFGSNSYVDYLYISILKISSVLFILCLMLPTNIFQWIYTKYKACLYLLYNYIFNKYSSYLPSSILIHCIRYICTYEEDQHTLNHSDDEIVFHDESSVDLPLDIDDLIESQMNEEERIHNKKNCISKIPSLLVAYIKNPWSFYKYLYIYALQPLLHFILYTCIPYLYVIIKYITITLCKYVYILIYSSLLEVHIDLEDYLDPSYIPSSIDIELELREEEEEEKEMNLCSQDEYNGILFNSQGILQEN
ncbi:hypothetical protein WA158_000938 [Blastocystis sp. Blastoise]